MSGIEGISAIQSSLGISTIDTILPQNIGAQDMGIQSSGDAKFADILADGLKNVEMKIDNANAMVRDFAVDESIPIHQVTMALEEARIAVELAMQVRSRLIEGYREIMNMQL